MFEKLEILVPKTKLNVPNFQDFQLLARDCARHRAPNVEKLEFLAY